MAYFITDATTLAIPACIVSPSICANTTSGALTSTGAFAPALGFAVLTKNGDNTFTIAISSADPAITGTTYTY